MEERGDAADTRPRRVGEHEGSALHLLSIPSFDAWPRELGPLDSTVQVLFVAADAREVGDAELLAAARRAVASGARFVATWGPGCVRVHDAFDRVVIDEHFREGEETVDDVILTTWHDREALDDALFFFLFAAEPASAYVESCRTRLAVAVGSDDWSARIEQALAAPEAFLLDRVAEDDHAHGPDS